MTRSKASPEARGPLTARDAAIPVCDAAVARPFEDDPAVPIIIEMDWRGERDWVANEEEYEAWMLAIPRMLDRMLRPSRALTVEECMWVRENCPYDSERAARVVEHRRLRQALGLAPSDRRSITGSIEGDRDLLEDAKTLRDAPGLGFDWLTRRSDEENIATAKQHLAAMPKLRAIVDAVPEQVAAEELVRRRSRAIEELSTHLRNFKCKYRGISVFSVKTLAKMMVAGNFRGKPENWQRDPKASTITCLDAQVYPTIRKLEIELRKHLPRDVVELIDGNKKAKGGKRAKRVQR